VAGRHACALVRCSDAVAVRRPCRRAPRPPSTKAAPGCGALPLPCPMGRRSGCPCSGTPYTARSCRVEPSARVLRCAPGRGKTGPSMPLDAGNRLGPRCRRTP
jgi:hypothetical protein